MMEMNKSLKTLFVILYKILIILCILSCSLCLYLSISIINQLLKQFYLKDFLVCIVMIITAIYTFYIAYCAHNECEKFSVHKDKRTIINTNVASVELDAQEIDNVKNIRPEEGCIVLYILQYNGSNECDVSSFIEDHTTGYECIVDKYDKYSIFKMVALGATVSEIVVHIGEYVTISNELISVVSKEELDKVIYAEACIKSMFKDEEDTEEKNEILNEENKDNEV